MEIDEYNLFKLFTLGTDYINDDWINIDPSFAPDLAQAWQNLNFTYQQIQDWINIGLAPQDAEFAHYLKSVKNLTPIEVLNNHQAESLRQEFKEYQQSQQNAQTIQMPPRNIN